MREKGSDAVRTNFAAHLYSEPFARLARHPRMIEPVQDLLGEAVYMHQFKINGKMAFDGDVWQWHQDYGTWKNDDLMPAERAMNIAIFLDDVNEFNGPLMFIPGSHKSGVRRREARRHDDELSAVDDRQRPDPPSWSTAPAARKAASSRRKGPAGSMIVFHSCLVHASTSNLSPWNRVSVYLSLCAVSNHIRRFKRPEYIAHRDFTPIDLLPDDCLLKDTRSTCRGRTACRRARSRPRPTSSSWRPDLWKDRAGGALCSAHVPRSAAARRISSQYFATQSAPPSRSATSFRFDDQARAGLGHGAAPAAKY